MKVLITGANGYLGTGVVTQLCDDGVDVIAADFSVSMVDSRADAIACDLFSVENPYTFFGKPDVLLHMAWRNGFVHNDVSHFEDLPNHYMFIKKMIDEGCKHIAVMGTMHEVGFYEGCIKEETITHPENLYGISKDALRNAVKMLCKDAGATYQWLRGFYIVGNSEFGSSIFSKLTAAEKQGKQTFPFTTGENQWDFIEYPIFRIPVFFRTHSFFRLVCAVKRACVLTHDICPWAQIRFLISTQKEKKNPYRKKKRKTRFLRKARFLLRKIC